MNIPYLHLLVVTIVRNSLSQRQLVEALTSLPTPKFRSFPPFTLQLEEFRKRKALRASPQKEQISPESKQLHREFFTPERDFALTPEGEGKREKKTNN